VVSLCCIESTEDARFKLSAVEDVPEELLHATKIQARNNEKKTFFISFFSSVHAKERPVYYGSAQMQSGHCF
jgi:hypothetical protein